ncbi:MAG TPA: CRISPR-associated endoribonuclease Cas6 [Balneolales bacterium]|nr:CRISPR-associated endoribonuclease Cas6 [Balneolales bacterium]
MRLHLKLSPNSEAVPFDHMHDLIAVLHNWLGWNEEHDAMSLYSMGWLKGGVKQKDHLWFPNGADWQLSFYNKDMAMKLLNGLMDEPEVIYGMRVYESRMQITPDFGGHFRFKVASPVLARNVRDDFTRQHLTFKDEEADAALTRVLRKKLEKAGYETKDREVMVGFDRSYPKAITKLVDIKGIKMKASMCPVIVHGTPEAVQFAWNVGVGELTGSGFGALW